MVYPTTASAIRYDATWKTFTLLSRSGLGRSRDPNPAQEVALSIMLSNIKKVSDYGSFRFVPSQHDFPAHSEPHVQALRVAGLNSRF